MQLKISECHNKSYQAYRDEKILNFEYKGCCVRFPSLNEKPLKMHTRSLKNLLFLESLVNFATLFFPINIMYMTVAQSNGG